MDRKLFSERLKKRREECGYKSLSAFAQAYNERFVPNWCELMGNKPNGGILGTLKSYENPNGSDPSLEKVANMCALLDCDIDYLLGSIAKPKHIYQAMHDQCGLSNAATEQLMYWNKQSGKYIETLNLVLVSANFDHALGYAVDLMRTKPIYEGLANIRAEWVQKTYSQPAPPEGYPDGSGLFDMYKQAETKYEIAKLRLTESLTFLTRELERIAVDKK